VGDLFYVMQRDSAKRLFSTACFEVHWNKLREHCAVSPKINLRQLHDNYLTICTTEKQLGLTSGQRSKLYCCVPIEYNFLSCLFLDGHIPASLCEICYREGRLHSLPHDNFRGITLSRVISKLFDVAIAVIYSSFWATSENPFELKTNLTLFIVSEIL